MIVLPHEGKWHIIFQRAHAQLAATIASHVAPDYLPGDISFSDLHTAIADHDDGRQKWKGRYHITKQGKPMDYNEQPLPMKLNQATKSVEKARYKSPWIGLLISMHHTSLYWPYKDKNEKIAAYIGAQKVVQEKLKKVLNIDEPAARQAYDFMRLCDEISLILCEERHLSSTEEIVAGWLGNIPVEIKCVDGAIAMSPWLFNKPQIVLSIFCYSIERRSFKNDKDLVRELSTTDPAIKSWVFKNARK